MSLRQLWHSQSRRNKAHPVLVRTLVHPGARVRSGDVGREDESFGG